jgi:hypothetical protein
MRFPAVRERHEEVGQLRVAMLLDEPRDVVAPASAARLAHERQGRLTDVGQGDRAVPRHGFEPTRTKPEAPMKQAAELGGERALRGARLHHDVIFIGL